jgi:HAD superfamily hydrolase (TIGR01509 family)
MSIKAVVFDFDGLILDTESNEFNSYSEIYKQHGVELPIEVWGQCVGTNASAFDVYAYLEQLVGQSVDREKLHLSKSALYEKSMLEAELRPGVREYLQSAKLMGLRIGLASSSPRVWVEGYLKTYGILDRFETIRTADDVEIVKPNPALYFKALEDLNVDASDAIAFEDSPNGALAAKRAGMYCVIVPNSVTRQLTFGETDLRIESMEQMSLQEVIAHLGTQR